MDLFEPYAHSVAFARAKNNRGFCVGNETSIPVSCKIHPKSHLIPSDCNWTTHIATFRALFSEVTSVLQLQLLWGSGWGSHRVFYNPSHTIVVHLPTEEHEVRVRAGMGDWTGLGALPRGHRGQGQFSEFSEQPVECPEPRIRKVKKLLHITIILKCGLGSETVHRLFYECFITRLVWKDLGNVWFELLFQHEELA